METSKNVFHMGSNEQDEGKMEGDTFGTKNL